MEVDSALFLLFVACVWFVMRLVPPTICPALLLLASLVFYCSSTPQYLLVLLAIACINYVAVHRLTVCKSGSGRRMVFAAAVAVNLASLAFFKWAAAAWVPSKTIKFVPLSRGGYLAFPLGLSFFTFQMLACLTDVYRGTYQWTTGLGSFFLFGLFFPQISAGPIPRADCLVSQLLCKQRGDYRDFTAGVSLIAYGLLKKFVVANRLNIYVTQVFSPELSLGGASVTLGLVFNAIQIYADFSGYTDIVRGTARLFGIELMENFNCPLLADSVTDFWRRWHISLSTWLRDYLYMPMVVRLRDLGTLGVIVAFLVTFVVCGVWHRATWTLFFWGALNGLALSVEFLTKRMRKRLFTRLPLLAVSVTSRVYALGVFVFAEVFFRADGLSQAWSLLGRVFHPSSRAGIAEVFAQRGPWLFILIFSALGCWYLLSRLNAVLRPSWTPAFVLLCAILVLVFGKLQEGDFIYVQF
jgi:D-alanyl-lipoteichoic acid acyltransferase DltB (MBOAT superfamily)